ncbi:hypothetical protein ARSEF4850_009612 [Beauveria asiatica]
MAVYWGQYWSQNSSNVRQERLAYYCDDTNVNIINIAFITGMTPVIVNFASAGDKCTQSMNNTGLLLCKEIEQDIKTCQGKGKTILISMGGAIPTASDWNSAADAEKSAQLIWDMFGRTERELCVALVERGEPGPVETHRAPCRMCA